MSFNIGSIQAFMGLDESGFVSGMLSAETASAVFGDKIVGLVNNPLLGTINLLKEVTGALTNFAVQAANDADDLGDMADATGATINQLIALQLAAENAGGNLQDVRTILFDIAERAEKAASDTGLQQKFIQLGVATHDSNGQLRSAYDILSDVAEAMSKMENGAQRAAIAKDLLGNSGQRLIPILLQGRDGLREAETQAHSFGLTMSEGAAEAARRAASLMEQFGGAVAGVKRTIGTSFLEGFIGDLNTSNGGVADLAASLNQTLAPAARDLGTFLKEILPSLDALLQWLRDAREGLESIASILGPLWALLSPIWDFLKWWADNAAKVSSIVPNLIQFGNTGIGTPGSAGYDVTDPDLYNRIKSRRNQIGM